MKDRKMDRFVILFPFSAGCISQSSVAVCETRQRREQDEATLTILTSGDCERKTRSSSSNNTTLHRPSISLGFQKVVKSFKSLSDLFLLDQMDDGDEYEGDREMEIGFPTDVKHVTHIGWDGFSTSEKASDGHPEQLLSLSSPLSWKYATV